MLQGHFLHTLTCWRFFVLADVEHALQVSTILQGMLCEVLPNPMAEYGCEADPEALEEVCDAVQQALDMPTTGRPLVVAFCTDGSRSLVVRLLPRDKPCAPHTAAWDLLYVTLCFSHCNCSEGLMLTIFLHRVLLHATVYAVLPTLRCRWHVH